jgi:hypothetical protein
VVNVGKTIGVLEIIALLQQGLFMHQTMVQTLFQR